MYVSDGPSSSSSSWTTGPKIKTMTGSITLRNSSCRYSCTSISHWGIEDAMVHDGHEGMKMSKERGGASINTT